MSGIAINTLYDTCKQQVSTPGNIYELGYLTCRTIKKYCGEEMPTVSKIQNLILNPARNLLGIYNLQNNLFNLWELPSLSQGLQTIKNTCDALPIFSAINLVESSMLNYVSCIKTPISFIQSSWSLKSSLENICSSGKSNETKKLNAIQAILDQLKTIDNGLQNVEGIPSNQYALYKACRDLEELIPQIDKSSDPGPHEVFGILNRMILNSSEINKNLSLSEISKLKEIIGKFMQEEYSVETLDTISDEFKMYLNSYDNKSGTKSLLEVLKCAISWILNASGMLKLFFLGFGISGTALFSLEICSFIIRLAISFYKNYLINM